MICDFWDHVTKDIVASISIDLLGCSFWGRQIPYCKDTQATYTKSPTLWIPPFLSSHPQQTTHVLLLPSFLGPHNSSPISSWFRHFKIPITSPFPSHLKETCVWESTGGLHSRILSAQIFKWCPARYYPFWEEALGNTQWGAAIQESTGYYKSVILQFAARTAPQKKEAKKRTSPHHLK